MMNVILSIITALTPFLSVSAAEPQDMTKNTVGQQSAAYQEQSSQANISHKHHPDHEFISYPVAPVGDQLSYASGRAVWLHQNALARAWIRYQQEHNQK